MAHIAVEQERSCLEVRQPVGRAVELARHRQDVRGAIVRECPHIAVPENLRLRREGDAVGGRRHPTELTGEALEAVKVHHDLLIDVIDVYVR